MLILILGAVLMLAVCIFIHELGHLVCGMLVGVKARIFSIGYGKGIWKKKIGDTIYQITAIPLGGYVLFRGDAYGRRLRGRKGELLAAPPLKRMIPVLGGPFFNLILGFIILFGLAYSGDGETSSRIFIDPSIQEISSAYQAGLRSGDEIVSINGEAVRTFEDIYAKVSLSEGSPLKIQYIRNERKQSITVVPGIYSSGGRPTIGVEPAGERHVVVNFEYSEQFKRWLHLVSGEPTKVYSLDEEQALFDSLGARERQDFLQKRAIRYLNDGDVIQSVEGEAVHTVGELQRVLGKHRGEVVRIQLDRKLYPLINPWASQSAEIGIPVLGADVLDLNQMRDTSLPGVEVKEMSLVSYDPDIKTKLANSAWDGKKFDDFQKLLAYLKSKGSSEVSIQLGDASYTAKFHWKPIGLLGFRPSIHFDAETVPTDLNFVQALANAGEKVYQNVSTTLKGIGMLLTGLLSPKENLSGPIGIVQFAGMSLEYGWTTYMDFVARISIALMIMNLLPIPMADGGHIVIYAYELVVGKPMPAQVIDMIFRLGFFFLLGLGLFVSFNDVMRFF